MKRLNSSLSPDPSVLCFPVAVPTIDILPSVVAVGSAVTPLVIAAIPRRPHAAIQLGSVREPGWSRGDQRRKHPKEAPPSGQRALKGHRCPSITSGDDDRGPSSPFDPGGILAVRPHAPTSTRKTHTRHIRITPSAVASKEGCRVVRHPIPPVSVNSAGMLSGEVDHLAAGPAPLRPGATIVSQRPLRQSARCHSHYPARHSDVRNRRLSMVGADVR